MGRWLLNVNVADGHVPVALWAVTAMVAIVLLVRDDARRWTITVLPAVGGGVLAGAASVWICNVTDVFGITLPRHTVWWMALAGGGIGLGVASLWRSAVWRKVLAAMLIVAAPLSAGMGINAGFGLTPTLGDVLGVSTLAGVGRLPGVTPGVRPAGHPPVVAAADALYRHWRPPADMPTAGRTGMLSGAQRIPSTGGFIPRNASIYLPPAALVKGAPALPVVVMMMGQPGSPTPLFVAGALNRLAAAHHGLAPVVVVADQIGAEFGQQPACSATSVYGNVQEYVNGDVVRYIQHHLNVSTNPHLWTIAGYSDGASCALEWATQFPQRWGNLISISGERYPAQTQPVQRLRDGFRGDVAAEKENMPAVFLARNRGRFAGHLAVFTAGALDPMYSRFAFENQQALRAAGFTTALHEVPGASHVGGAVSGGLLYAFARLYPAIGLAPAA